MKIWEKKLEQGCSGGFRAVTAYLREASGPFLSLSSSVEYRGTGGLVSPERCAEALTPGPAHVTLTGNQVFVDVI